MARRLRLAAPALGLIVVLLIPVAVSAAPGLSLAWDHCLSEGTGTQNKVFACDTNVGTNDMVGTFELASAFEEVTATEIVLQLATASPALPPWWRVFNAPSACRPGGLLVSTIIEDVTCPDWSDGEASLLIGFYCTSDGPCPDRPAAANQARIKLLEAVPSVSPKALQGGQPYFAFHLLVNRQRTVGTGSCAGCDVPVCIVLNSIDVFTANTFVSRSISNASSPGANFVTWQGGGGTNCPAATPTRNQTWGAVKSMYR